VTVLGNLALWLALLVGVWGALAGFVGGRPGRPELAHSARRAVFAMCGALLVAVFALEWALFQHDFNVEYVAAYTSRNLPIFYTWSALYAGQKGSLLFWATVLSLFGSLALVLSPRCSRNGSTATGWSRFASGRSCPGCSSRSGSVWGCGGRTWSWAGAVTGRGIPWKTRRCSRGSP